MTISHNDWMEPPCSEILRPRISAAGGSKSGEGVLPLLHLCGFPEHVVGHSVLQNAVKAEPFLVQSSRAALKITVASRFD